MISIYFTFKKQDQVQKLHRELEYDIGGQNIVKELVQYYI